MANVSITAANVVKGSNAVVDEGTAGEALTGGQTACKKTDGKYYKADCDATAVTADAHIKEVEGIVLNASVAASQPVDVQTDGDITIGGTIVAGQSYYQSSTAGSICLFSDLSSTDHVVLIGVGNSTSVLRLAITDADAQVA